MSIIQGAGAGLGGAGAPGGALAGGAVLGSHAINQSLRFNDNDSAYLSRTPASAGNSDTWTISMWVKRSSLGDSKLFAAGSSFPSNHNNAFYMWFQSDDTLRIRNESGGSYYTRMDTTRVFRDLSAFYHIVYVYDSSQATSTNRQKLYINGVEETSFDHTTYPALNQDSQVNKTHLHVIGASTVSNTFDGYMAEVNFIDGTALDPNSFGETIDGVWVPKEYSGSYGSAGYYLPFAQDTASGASAFFDQDDNGYIAWTDPGTQYEIGASDDFTVEFFFNPTTTEMSAGSNIIGYYKTTSTVGYFMVTLNISTRKINLYYGNGSAYEFSTFASGDVVENKWHHIAINRNSGTITCWLDGSQVGSTVNSNTKTFDIPEFRVNKAHATSNTTFDGSISNVRLVIGSAVYANGSTITVPTSTLTNITNTRLLACTTSTLTQDASSNNVTGTVTNSTASISSPFADFNFYDDTSGNTNNFTATNLAVYDVVPDSPTNNFATLNPLQNSGGGGNWYAQATLSEGNLKASLPANSVSCATMKATGKLYAEVRWSTIKNELALGLIIPEEYTTTTAHPTNTGANSWRMAYSGGAPADIFLVDEGTSVANPAQTVSAGDIFQVAWDTDNGNIWFGYNNSWYDSSGGTTGNPSTGANPTMTATTADLEASLVYIACGNSTGVGTINFGQDSTFAGAISAGGNADANNIGDFAYAPPSGFLAICASNLPEPAIGPGQSKQADDYFETMLYTGNDGEQHIGAGGAQHPQDIITIANSLRFNDDDSAYLANPNLSSSPTDTKKKTFSWWMKIGNTSIDRTIASTYLGGEDTITLNSSNKIHITAANGGGLYESAATFNSVSTWYHFVYVVDTTESTATDRLRLYINGVLETSTSNYTDPGANATTDTFGKTHLDIGRNDYGNNKYGDFYLAEVNFIDGQALDPTYFGQVGSNGYWIPKTISGLTYGNNGFRLTFQNSSYLGYDYQTSDRSGTTNDFDVYQLASTDRVIDSPTQNFATLNASGSANKAVLSEGNLKAAPAGFSSSAYGYGAISTFAIPKNKKIYIEVECTDTTGDNWFAGFATQTSIAAGAGGNTGSDGSINAYNRGVKINGTETDYGSSAGLGGLGVQKLAAGDILGCAIDGATGKVWFHRNGTYFKSPSIDDSGTTGNPSAGSNEIGALTGGTTDDVFFVLGGSASSIFVNFGQDSVNVASAETDANGIGTFEYAPPTDYVALIDDNIAQEGIANPDWVWIKERNNTKSHYLFDTVRGATKNLHTDDTAVEATDTDSLLSFGNQGFTVGSNGDVNGSADTYVAWTWKAGGPSPTQTYAVTVADDGGQNKYRFDGNATFAPTLSLQEGGTYTFDQSDSSNSGHPLRFSTTSNGTHNSGSEYTVGVTTTGTPGSAGAKTVITVARGAPTLYYYCTQHSGMGGQANTTETHGSTNLKGSIQSVVSAAPDAGFSIVSYTGTGANATVGHGLTKKPEWLVTKSRDSALNWSFLQINDMTTDKVMALQATNAEFSSPGSFIESDFTATTFGVGTETPTNKSGDDFICYCFHSVPGYSAVGKYVGNGSTNGTFVYTGFRPAFWLMKSISDATHWVIYDAAREPENTVDLQLLPNEVNAEAASGRPVDFLSNGVKLRFSSYLNDSGQTYIYLAFAETPFKFANAR